MVGFCRAAHRWYIPVHMKDSFEMLKSSLVLRQTTATQRETMKAKLF